MQFLDMDVNLTLELPSNIDQKFHYAAEMVGMHVLALGMLKCYFFWSI